MAKHWFKRLFFRVEIILIFLAIVSFFLQQQMAQPEVQFQTNKVAPPLEISYLSVGFKPQLSDSFWLRSVQDTEYCEKMLDSSKCVGQSWFFNIINLAIELDPLFSEAYYYGGLSLTVFIHDSAGASIIFDKAVKIFKYEWPMLYLAAYHALFEEKDYLKASKLYLRAADNGAPAWVRLSAGKLAVNGGDPAAAKEILNQLIRSEADESWVRALKEKLNSADQLTKDQ